MVPTVTVGLTYDTTLSGVMQAFSRVKGKKLPADRKDTIRHNAKKARGLGCPRFLGFIAYSPNTALW